MECLAKKACSFLIIFVVLSTLQKITGIGSQPQFICKLQNTFQMSTYMKKDPNPSTDSVSALAPLNAFGFLQDILRRICPKKEAISETAKGAKLSMFASPRRFFLHRLNGQSDSSIEPSNLNESDNSQRSRDSDDGDDEMAD